MEPTGLEDARVSILGTKDWQLRHAQSKENTVWVESQSPNSLCPNTLKAEISGFTLSVPNEMVGSHCPHPTWCFHLLHGKHSIGEECR